MDIEINNTKQQAQFKNGKYYQLFTPTGSNDKVKLYHMGCVGDTRLTHIQLEQGNRPTTFVEPKQKANSLSGIFQKLRDINVLMKDSDSEFWTRIKQNARGTIEEYHNNTLKNEITKTAEGVFEKQTKTINTNIDEKIKTAKTAIDKTITAETKKFADELSSRITTVQNESVKKNEVSVTENGVRIGSTELIDGRKLTSIITTQPENIKAITDRMIITPSNENLVRLNQRNHVVSTGRDIMITDDIYDKLLGGEEFYFKAKFSNNERSKQRIGIHLYVTYTDNSQSWGFAEMFPVNSNVNNDERVATLKFEKTPGKEVKFYTLGIHQSAWNNFTNWDVRDLVLYKKKSAELIVDGSIEGRHVKANTLETGHHKAGSITSDIIAANAVNVNHIDINDALIRELVAHKAFINQLWAQQAFINNLKTVNFDFTKGTGSYIQSKNGGMKWDLDSNKLIMDQGSIIQYNTSGNALVFEDRLNTSTGISFNLDEYNKATVTVGGSHGIVYGHNQDSFTGLKIYSGDRIASLSGNKLVLGWDLDKVNKDSNKNRFKVIVIDEDGIVVQAGGNQGLFVNAEGAGYTIDNTHYSFQSLHTIINKLITAVGAIGNGEESYSLPPKFPEKKEKIIP